MFLQGTLTVDPAQLTHIIRKKPTKAFKKMLYLLTAGGLSEKQEHETFCAISILQQVNAALRSLGITNIVHLAKDDVDFYLDEEGKKDDLKEAMDHFKLEVDQVEASAFQTLKLVLEHEDADLNYLIAIHVERVHAPGVYPIHVEVDGLFKGFSANGATAAEMRARLKSSLRNQDQHDKLVAEMHHRFEHFLGELTLALKKYVGVDDIRQSVQKNLVRPKKRTHQLSDIRQDRKAGRPVYYGYHQSADAFLYAWIWADVIHDLNHQVSDCHVVDEEGALMMTVGEAGFEAGASDALNPDAAFEVPSGADINLGDSADLPESMGSLDAGGDSGGFLGGFFDSIGDFGGGDSGGDGGSSCSSCSSCGGGCGGCGG